MKINIKDPKHLKALCISAVYSVLTVAARPFIKNKSASEKIIIFYGHTLNGNLKAFFDFLLDKKGFKPYFLALDKNYFKRLKKASKKPDAILSALSVKDMLVVGRSSALITSHGLHSFSILRLLTNIKFIDVWHAVSYKGFDVKDFRHLHSHDEIWVSSKYIREMYINRFGFVPQKVRITGYGRTDQLVNGKLNKKDIVEKYSIPKAKKYVLIAPTWKHDHSGRNVLPFDISEDVFFNELDNLANKNSAHIIFRTHLNSDEDLNVSHLNNTSFMPYSKYEVVEEFLFIADVLVTDWSSIGIDFLPLKRPTIFLDITPPFKKGFELGPEHRYGDIASTFSELKKYLVENIRKPKVFQSKHKKQISTTTKIAYGRTLDGKSVERYFENLQKILSPTE